MGYLFIFDFGKKLGCSVTDVLVFATHFWKGEVTGLIKTYFPY